MAYESRKAQKREDNLNYISRTVAEIAKIKPDLIALPEVFPGVGLDPKEKILGPGKELMVDLARKYQTCIVGSLYEKRGGKIYNTALVVDRKGGIAGRYDKIHLFGPEMTEHGVTPGRKDQLPIKTDIGTIGVQVCFDANWPHEWERLVDTGAELIVFSSAFPGGKILDSLALLNKVYVVPATWSLDSGIINNTGQWVVKTDRFSWWVWSEIDLERTVFHWDFQETKTREIAKKYGNKIKIECFGSEAWFVLEPNDREISIDKIIKEFKLVTYRDYIKRATTAQDKERM